MPRLFFFHHCRCPNCRAKLDRVNIHASACPHCNALLDPREVMRTRSWYGYIALPAWADVVIPLGFGTAGGVLVYGSGGSRTRPIDFWLGVALVVVAFIWILLRSLSNKGFWQALFGPDD